MAYKDIRDHIKTVLEGLSITTPIAQSIKRVYPEPPATIQDRPCFVMCGPSAGEVDFTMGAAAIHEEDTEHVQLIISDADVDRAIDLTRAYRAALVEAFKSHGGLGGYGPVRRIRWEDIRSYSYARSEYVGQDFYIEFEVKTP